MGRIITGESIEKASKQAWGETIHIKPHLILVDKSLFILGFESAFDYFSQMDFSKNENVQKTSEKAWGEVVYFKQYLTPVDYALFLLGFVTSVDYMYEMKFETEPDRFDRNNPPF